MLARGVAAAAGASAPAVSRAVGASSAVTAADAVGVVSGKRLRHTGGGPPLRSGVSGIKATIFGAYGFLGRYVVNRLGNTGTTCIIPFRGDDMEWRHLKVMGDYGNIVPMPFSPRDEDSLRRCIDESDVVINLIGKDYETSHYLPWIKNFTFHDTHVEVAERIAKISVELGVPNLVHISALAANRHSKSEFGRTKALGEQAVRAVAPGATIVRPADMFGAEDRLLNLFARMHYALPRTLLVDGGRASVQPVFAEDVAEGIFRIATSTDPEVCLAQTYDFAGPDQYTWREIIEYVFETIRAVEPNIANVSPQVADVIGRVFDLFPNPILGPDKLARMTEDVLLDEGAPSKRLADLGIAATSLETPGFSHLWRFREGGAFLDVMETETPQTASH